MDFTKVRTKVVWGACIVLTSALLLAPNAAEAQTAQPDWLRSIDELMDVTVTSASKRERRLADTAAAVFVLTRDDIRRSGVNDVPGLLRLVPGVQVAQIDGNKWSVTVRGFSGRWANKLLVMIDGQSVYSDVISGVYWDALDVPIDSIERIEVVRGPGGSLWGANAVNGVIDIITRTPATRGGAITGTLGTIGLSTGLLRYAGPIGAHVRYHTYAGAGDQDAMLAELTDDKWQSMRFGGGAVIDLSSRDSIDVQAAGHRSDTWATASRLALAPPVVRSVRVDDTVATVYRTSAKWARALGDGGALHTSGSWVNLNRDDRGFVVHSNVWEFSFQHSAGRRGRHELTWGAAYRQSTNTMQGSDTFDVNPGVVRQSQTGAFAQDDITFAGNRLVVTLGSKLEHFTQTGWHWQPTARALWNVTPRQSLWAAASRAVRTPSLVERGMMVNVFASPAAVPLIGQLAGNPNLQEESLKAYEAGYRWTASVVSVDLAAYVNRYTDAVNQETGTAYLVAGRGAPPHLILPMTFNNNMNVATAGGEALVTVSASPRWRIVGSYGLVTTRYRSEPNSGNLTASSLEGESPRHQGTVRSLFALRGGVDLDTTMQFVGQVRATNVPSYMRLDTRVGWRVLPSLDLSLLARNVLDSRHVEFQASSAGVVFGRTRRQISVTTTWRF